VGRPDPLLIGMNVNADLANNDSGNPGNSGNSGKPVKSAKPVSFGLSSIGARLFLAVMTAASIGLGGLGTLFYNELKSVKLLQLTTDTDIQARELDAELRSGESFLKSLVAATTFLQASGVRSPAAYDQLVQSFMSVRPNLITGFGLLQTPHGLVDRQWFGPYIEESQPNRGVNMPEDPRFSAVDLWPVEQYPKLQYYTDAVRANHYFWSKPYLNDSYPVPLTTFAGPIHDRQGKLIAVMNGDIAIKDLNQFNRSYLSKNDSSRILVTEDGTFLSYSNDPQKAANLENIASIPALNLVWRTIQEQLAQGQSQGYFESDSTDSYWVYQQIPSSQWIILQAIPYRVVIQPALLGAVGATLVAGMILGLVVWLFTRFLSHRLQSILDICDTTIIYEDYSTGAQDEIGQFSNAFLSLVKQQSTLLEQLQLTNAELIRSNRLKDSFLANMSHELRTPLNAILGMTEGLQEGILGTLNKQQLKALQTVERSGSHLLALINDILDLAKIEAGQVQLDCNPTPVAPLCQSSLAFVKQQALKKRIQLQVRLSPHLPSLMIDERRIRQVLINLLSNAVKFTPEAGKVTLEARLESAPHSPDSTDPTPYVVRFTVIDTGIGIAPEHLATLFRPFTQIDNGLNRQYDGTGLGLALVKQTVELHGGQVGVSSEVNLGSRFWIDLPCLAPPVAEIATLSNGAADLPSDLTSLESKEIKLNPLILLVEDDAANISTISSYLNAKGYRMVVTHHGQEALDWLELQQPDLILMDIQMPGIDGLEAIRQIRANPTFQELPIIALTALAMTGDRERVLAAGATDYCTKPVKLKQLAGVIQDLL